jgi:hypothetical protein
VSTLYEILELPNGDIVLQRVEGDAEPLVSIRFSEQARAYMSDASLDVARAMVEAGVKAISDLSQEAGPDIAERARPRQLH